MQLSSSLFCNEALKPVVTAGLGGLMVSLTVNKQNEPCLVLWMKLNMLSRLFSGSVNSSKSVGFRLLSDRVLWTQYCQLSQRPVATHSLLVGQQMQSWGSHRGVWTQEETRQTRYHLRDLTVNVSFFISTPSFVLHTISRVFCVLGGFFVTGINLTEDLKYICTHPTESLKDLVMSTYPTLLSWVKEQTPGSKVGSINIIAGDFITESHFVPTVVTLNEKLLKWPSWLFTQSLTAWNTHKPVLLVTWKYLNYWSNINALIRGREMYFRPKDALFGILPALRCLHLVHYLSRWLYYFSQVSTAASFKLWKQ